MFLKIGLLIFFSKPKINHYIISLLRSVDIIGRHWGNVWRQHPRARTHNHLRSLCCCSRGRLQHKQTSAKSDDAEGLRMCFKKFGCIRGHKPMGFTMLFPVNETKLEKWILVAVALWTWACSVWVIVSTAIKSNCTGSPGTDWAWGGKSSTLSSLQKFHYNCTKRVFQKDVPASDTHKQKKIHFRNKNKQNKILVLALNMWQESSIDR